MVTKIKGLIELAISNLPNLGPRGSLPMWVIMVFGTIFFMLHILFIIAWVDDWRATGKPNLAMLDTFTKTVAGETVVISFLATYLVDDDKDGKPDIIEKAVQNERSNL